MAIRYHFHTHKGDEAAEGATHNDMPLQGDLLLGGPTGQDTEKWEEQKAKHVSSKRRPI
jgi:hypothetical protein